MLPRKILTSRTKKQKASTLTGNAKSVDLAVGERHHGEGGSTLKGIIPPDTPETYIKGEKLRNLYRVFLWDVFWDLSWDLWDETNMFSLKNGWLEDNPALY